MPKPNAPRRYAEGTAVPAEKSRAELETLLGKYGATEFALYTSAERWIIAYRIKERMVRHTVERPQAVRPKYPVLKELKRAEALADAEWRRRWRALLLLVKAKLELIASGQSTIEREFMADVLLPNGQTVHEYLSPKLEDAYRDGAMPTLLLGAGL